jgi:hypothetical protein
MKDMTDAVLEVLVGVVLLVVLGTFLATANLATLGTTGVLIIGFIPTLLALGLMYRGVSGLVSGRHGI